MSTSEHLFPKVATAERLRDYLEWHVQNGRGHMPVALDPRGLSYLTEKHDVRLALPLGSEGGHDEERVFVRAVF